MNKYLVSGFFMNQKYCNSWIHDCLRWFFLVVNQNIHDQQSDSQTSDSYESF